MAQVKRPNITAVTYTIDNASKKQLEKTYNSVNAQASKAGRSKVGKGILLGKIIELAAPLVSLESFYPPMATTEK
jgi:hypothetical protein